MVLRQIELENETIYVAVLPDRGCRIRSIYHKKKHFELLFQAEKMEETGDINRAYPQATWGAPFSQYDCSGLDDCLPTIDPCVLPGKRKLPDHGDCWSLPWTVREEESRQNDRLVAEVALRSLPLTLRREILLEEEGLLLRYQLRNWGESPCPWLWALHGLVRLEDDCEVHLPLHPPLKEVNRKQVVDLDRGRFFLRDLPAGDSFKYYLEGPLEEGHGEIRYPRHGIRYTVDFDAQQLPYLGLWVTTGGFRGEKNLALEPSNAFYDRLDRAMENQTAGWINPGQVREWWVRLGLQEAGSGKKQRKE